MMSILRACLFVFLCTQLVRAEVIDGSTGTPISNNWNMVFNFIEGAGTVTVDSSSNSLTADLVNGTAWVSGMTGRSKALFFDDLNDQVNVNVGQEGLFDYVKTSTFTILALVRHTAGLTSDQWIYVAKINTGGNPGWWFMAGQDSTKRLSVFMYDGAGGYCNTTSANIAAAELQDGNWHVVGFVYRGNFGSATLREYWLDGVNRGSSIADCPGGASGTIANNLHVSFGDMSGGAGTNMDGEIGLVMMSRIDYPITGEEIKFLSNRILGRVSNGAR